MQFEVCRNDAAQAFGVWGTTDMSVALDLRRARPNPAAQPAEDESDISALIDRLTAEVNQIACEKSRSIRQITNQMKMLALNALIESSRAGVQGAGFAVVAQEVRAVGQQVETIARELEGQLTSTTVSQVLPLFTR
jgi:hypothetical protein